MRRAIEALAIAAAGVVLLAATGLAWIAQDHVFAHRDRVAALLAAEPSPPSRIVDVVMKVEGDYAASWVARSLVVQTHDVPMRGLERHLTGAIWAAWLSVALDDAEIVSLYAHFLPFEDGDGLAYGARRYFGKAPADLTPDEVLGLVAIARAPRRNSPEQAPERYRREVERLRLRYFRGVE